MMRKLAFEGYPEVHGQRRTSTKKTLARAGAAAALAGTAYGAYQLGRHIGRGSATRDIVDGYYAAGSVGDFLRANKPAETGEKLKKALRTDVVAAAKNRAAKTREAVKHVSKNYFPTFTRGAKAVSSAARNAAIKAAPIAAKLASVEDSVRSQSALAFVKEAADTIPENIDFGFMGFSPRGRGPIVTWDGPILGPIKSTSEARMERAIEYAQAKGMGPLVMDAVRNAHVITQAQEAIHATARNS